jgi:hypothetical protein
MATTNSKLYKYALAAEDIGEDFGLSRETISNLTLEMASAIRTNNLTVRDKNTFGPINVSNTNNSEEILWVNVEDMNTWLSKNGYPYNWIPSTTSENIVTTALIGIPSEDVAMYFDGIHFDSKRSWSRALADAPNWLKACLTVKGSKGKKRSACWDPVLIAITLNSNFKIPKKNLDPIFASLKDYLKEWQQRSEYMDY